MQRSFSLKTVLLSICVAAVPLGIWGSWVTGAAAQTGRIAPSASTASTTPISRYDAELLRLTNVERQRAGVPPLRFSNRLGQAAQRHAEDMVANRFFSHTGSNGSTMVDRASAVGYHYRFLGENIAAGAATPETVIRQWMQSAGHRRNLLNRNFTEIGFGYVPAGDRYRHYWVQVFGTPQN